MSVLLISLESSKTAATALSPDGYRLFGRRDRELSYSGTAEMFVLYSAYDKQDCRRMA